jgi:hypothetical protein
MVNRLDEDGGLRVREDVSFIFFGLALWLQDNQLLIPMLLLINFFGVWISYGTFPKSADHVEISLNIQRNSIYRKNL